MGCRVRWARKGGSTHETQETTARHRSRPWRLRPELRGRNVHRRGVHERQTIHDRLDCGAVIVDVGVLDQLHGIVRHIWLYRLLGLIWLVWHIWLVGRHHAIDHARVVDRLPAVDGQRMHALRELIGIRQHEFGFIRNRVLMPSLPAAPPLIHGHDGGGRGWAGGAPG
jgi:hypothetical protein